MTGGRIRVFVVDLDGERRTIPELMAKYGRSRKRTYDHLEQVNGEWHLRPNQPIGRPRMHNFSGFRTIQMRIELSEEELQAIEAHAQANGYSTNTAIRREAIRPWIQSLFEAQP